MQSTGGTIWAAMKRTARGRALLCAAAGAIALICGAPTAALAAPGDVVWKHDFALPSINPPTSLALNPLGTRMYVGGYRNAPSEALDISAWATGDGSRMWGHAYGTGFTASNQDPISVASDGTRTYVLGTGVTSGSGSGPDYALAAYDAKNGTRLWVQKFNGQANGDDHAAALALSPDGKRVYVTGSSWNGRAYDYATASYDSATGAPISVIRFGGLAAGVSSIAVSPDGGRVFITGSSTQGVCTTVAYAAPAERIWFVNDANPGYCSNFRSSQLSKALGGLVSPPSLVVDPGGERVYMIATSHGSTNGDDYLTVAYDAATGAKLWSRRYDGAGAVGSNDDTAGALAISPDGTRLYVTGTSPAPSPAPDGCSDYSTLAYDAANGTRLWGHRFRGTACNAPSGARVDAFPASVAASPDGQAVYVTGTSDGAYATVAYGAASGKQLWGSRLTDMPGCATALAVAPDSARVYLTGTAPCAPTGTHLGLLALAAR